MFGKLLKGVANMAMPLLGQHLGAKQQSRNIRRTNQANLDLANLKYDRDMEMAEYSFDKNLEMWKMQNQYNSPEEQMARFEDAGLNKHMIYGQGTPGNATGSPSFTAPSFQAPTMDYRGIPDSTANVLNSFVGASEKNLQLLQQKEQLEQSEVETWLSNTTKMDRATIQENMAKKSFWDNKSAEVKSRIDEIHRNMWEDNLNPNDPAWMRGMQKLMDENPEILNSMKPIFDRTLQMLEAMPARINSIFDTFDELKNALSNPSQLLKDALDWNYPGDSQNPIERIKSTINN